MTNVEMLKTKIDDSGMTITAISKKSGIKRPSLYNKINGKTEFTATEIRDISSVLGLKKKEVSDIFLQ